MKTTKMLVCCILCAVVVGNAVVGLSAGSDSQNFMSDPPTIVSGKTFTDKERARAALLYINHLNHVVAKLDNMHDLMILQQEYENLTDDNLNLETIHDETTVQLIVQLMEQLCNLQKANIRAIQAQVAFEKQKKDAIWKALPQPSVLFVANDPYTLALAVGGAALTSIQNYYGAISDAEIKKSETEFRIADDIFTYIKEINKELFLSQWRLMRDYHISDRERVTREDSRLFLGFSEVLKDCNLDDQHRNRLVYNVFRGHELDMRNLPFYWITRAAAARALGEKDDIKNCCVRYFALYKDAPIVRRDMDACAMALLYVSVAMQGKKILTDGERASIRKWLKFIEATVRIPEWQTKFAVAMLYRKLGENVEAKRVLAMTLDEVYACIRVWEQSRENKNIFRKTPALEKAYAEPAKTAWSEKWPDWKSEAKCMVPYEGYVWLGGALAEMGEEHVFDERPLDDEKIGKSKLYCSGTEPKIRPTLSREGNVFRVESNGLWEEDAAVVKLFVDNETCVLESSEKGKLRFKMTSTLKPTKIIVSVVTRFGIKVNYSFNPDSLAAQQTINVVYPWTIDISDKN